MKRLILSILACLLLAAPALAFDGACQDGEPWQLARMNPAVLGSGVAGCVESYGSELATTSNSCDVGAAEEQEDADGFTNSGSNPFDGSGTANTGSFALRATANGDANDGFYRALTGSTNTLYKLTAYVRHNGTAAGTGLWRCHIARAVNYKNFSFCDVTKDVEYQTYTKYTKYYYWADTMDTFFCYEVNAENDGGIYLDDFSYKTATPCLGGELNTVTDAATIGANESDDYTDWTNSGSGTLDSVTTDPGDGTYHLTFAASAGGDKFYRDISSLVTVGKTYLLSLKHKSVSGDPANCGLYNATNFASLSNEMQLSGAEWQKYGFSFTYDGTYKYFGCAEGGAANNSAFYLDAFSIREIESE